MQYVVGLTGGIGSGKTVVSDHFAKLGVPIIDTDVIARLIVAPDKPVLKKLVEVFGDEILQKNGELDRSALRTIAFSSADNKTQLDSITHPAIRTETLLQITQANYPYCLVVVPLLTADSPFIEVMQRVLVITAKRETKIKRVEKRSHLSRDEVEGIMATQLSDKDRLTFVDDVIANDGSIEEAQREVDKLHQLYLKLSSKN